MDLQVPHVNISCFFLILIWTLLPVLTSLVAQRLKRLPGIQETQVRSLGREDPPGEGNGNPLWYSCLENPMEGGDW